MKFTDFHFGAPIMRLLYLHNKTDLAMELFMDEVRRIRSNQLYLEGALESDRCVSRFGISIDSAE